MLERILPGKVVDYRKYSATPNITRADDLASICKPHDQFYQEFNTTYNADGSAVV